MELANKIIVITGAGSGIGRALAIRFKAEGAKQIVAVDINAENAQATAAYDRWCGDDGGCLY